MAKRLKGVILALRLKVVEDYWLDDAIPKKLEYENKNYTVNSLIHLENRINGISR
jgi:hypothetical protein